MKSNFTFNKYSKSSIDPFLSIREGETKIGQTCQFDYSNNDSKYVILGISEDIGPQSNLGFSGSDNAFKSFITRFVNMQDNRFLKGNSICILGEIKSNDLFESIETGRKLISELDEFVKSIVEPIILSGKIPIVIGGGHNNAFPLIWASSLAKKESINVVNLDPHADCRALEGRHSGNPFSYAKHHQYLDHYSVLGLHQQYNNEMMYTYLEANNFNFTFFEDYLFNNRSLTQDIEHFAHVSFNKSIGVELDLDTIAFMPSSAFTPSGFTVNDARKYIHTIAKHKNISYLHLPEGAPSTLKEEKIVGKTLAYLVSDFIKQNTNFQK
jgi:formiminoglutamase